MNLLNKYLFSTCVMANRLCWQSSIINLIKILAAQTWKCHAKSAHVPFRKVNYLAQVGLPNISGRSSYLFMPTLADAPCFCSTSGIFFKSCLLSSQHPSPIPHPGKRPDCSSPPLLCINMENRKHFFLSVILFHLCITTLEKHDWSFPPKGMSFQDNGPITSFSCKCRLQT